MSSHSQQESSQQLNTGEQLLFILAEHRLCLPISAVSEVLSSTSLRPVPFAAPHIAGLVSVRSLAWPVIDLHNLLFCRAPINFDPTGCAYIALAEQQIVLAVDKVLGIEPLEPQECSPGNTALSITSELDFKSHEDLVFRQVSVDGLLSALTQAVDQTTDFTS